VVRDLNNLSRHVAVQDWRIADDALFVLLHMWRNSLSTSPNWCNLRQLNKKLRNILKINLIWGEPSSCVRWNFFAVDFLRLQVVKTEVFQLAFRNRTYPKRSEKVWSDHQLLNCNTENNINSTSYLHTSDYCILCSRYLVPAPYNPFLRHLVVDWCKFAREFPFHLHMSLNTCCMVPMQNNHHPLW